MLCKVVFANTSRPSKRTGRSAPKPKAGITSTRLFLTEDGYPLTDKRNQKILERVGRKASIGEGLSPHKLRHTFATLSLKYGSNLEYIRMMLGRTDIRTASQAYLHVASADLAEASKHTSPIINLGIGKGKSPIKPATDKKAPLTEQTIVVQVKPFKPDLETGNRSGFL